MFHNVRKNKLFTIGLIIIAVVGLFFLIYKPSASPEMALTAFIMMLVFMISQKINARQLENSKL